MNTAHDNDVDDNDMLITRLRSALDEVTADSHGLVTAESSRHDAGVGRWIAVAAAVVLVVGAVAAIAINRRNAPGVASVPTELTTTTPTTQPLLTRVANPWFRLIAADLVPGERTNTQASPSKLLTMAWSRAEPLAYLTLTAFATTQVPKSHPSSFLAGATVRETPDGGVLAFTSYDLTDDEREALADQVVPGSGLPYLLPVNGWEMSAFGYSSSDNRLEQVYTPLNQDPLSNYLPTVRMSVGEYGGELSFLSWTDPQPITVAGYDGWKVTDNDGTVTAFWDAGDGNWATLRIDAKLADRADALIASVIQVTDEATNEPTAETVLPPASSESPLPAVGSQLTGNLFPVASKGPTLFVFVDPGCVPCTNAIRTLLVAEAASPTQVPQIALVVDRPSDDPGTTDWLAEIAWEGTVVDDSDGSSSALFGVDAVPYYVFVTISSDGTILDLIQGLFTSETLAELGIT